MYLWLTQAREIVPSCYGGDKEEEASNYILGHLPLRGGAASSPSTSNGNQPGLDELFARKNRKINRTSSTFILHKKKVEQT